MTVAELIAELEKIPPGARACDGQVPVTSVSYHADYGIVILWFDPGA